MTRAKPLLWWAVFPLSFRLVSVAGHYEIIADTLRWITGDHRKLRELARRAAFNIQAGNWDDHAKNFSLFMDSTGQWSQSPAYDITPSPGPGRQGIHVASLKRSATRSKKDFLALAKRAQLNDTDEIFEKASDAVRRWPDFAEQSGRRNASIKTFAHWSKKPVAGSREF